tara:strand:+ start:881 stop:1351 length:471 start_codon:yes stop_codon:yes gene_type:complete
MENIDHKIIEESKERGILPDPSILTKLKKYSELVLQNKAEVNFFEQSMYIGTLEFGRLKWDYNTLTQLVQTGTPWQRLIAENPVREDQKGSKSDRVDYPWSKTSEKTLFDPQTDTTEHVDGISNYMRVEDIYWLLVCSVFFWNGRCSFEIYDMQNL